MLMVCVCRLHCQGLGIFLVVSVAGCAAVCAFEKT